MKWLSLLGLLLASSLHGQDTLTIGQIFDFDINDEFHSRQTYPSVPPNATRMKIIGKAFSADSDTVFYTRSFNNYHAIFVQDSTGPHLEYDFDVYTSGVYYTNLDSVVSCIATDSSCTMSFGLAICGIPSVEISYAYGKLFEGADYGKGLGETRSYSVDMGAGGGETEMFYFKKDTMECGSPDLTSSIASPAWLPVMAEISPNPFTDQAELRIASAWLPCTITILDSRGTVVFQTNNEGHEVVTLSDLMAKGVYIIKIESTNSTGFLRVVKM